jgi:hypothetical protein
VVDERLHLGLAEGAAAGAGEASSEALDPGHADAGGVHLHHRRFPFQHLDADVLQLAADLVATVGVVIVVAQDGDGGDPQVPHLLDQHGPLVGVAVGGQVAGQQEQVGPVGHGFEVRTEAAGGVRAHVDVAHRGHPNHGMLCSVGVWARVTPAVLPGAEATGTSADD